MEFELFWIAIAIATPVILLLVVTLYYTMRKRYAKRKVAGRTTEEKVTELNVDLEPFGFWFDENQDMVYSAMNPWQREMGYCRWYDRVALAMNMAIESEPIYFNYNNRRWLIEFWKGQYGITTGGEVGIYVTDKDDISVPGVFEGPFFDAVRDDERIPMEFLLYRKHKPLLTRRENHWWLTAFDVGIFTKPKNLSMDIRLTFPNRAMLMAFVGGLRNAGYREGTYLVHRNVVQIHFTEPRTKQPHRKFRLWFAAVQVLNCFYCLLYQNVTKDFVKTLDKIDYLRFLFPWLYRMLVDFAKPEKLQKRYRKLKKKAGEVTG